MLTVAISNHAVFMIQRLPSILGQSAVSEQTVSLPSGVEKVYIYAFCTADCSNRLCLADETDGLLHASSPEDWCERTVVPDTHSIYTIPVIYARPQHH